MEKTTETTTPQSATDALPENTVFPGTPDLSHLRSADGTTWRDFRRVLGARYAMVWLDVGCRYAAMFGTLALACWVAATWGNLVGLFLSPFFAVIIGLWFATLVLFMHEGAHYNLAPAKKTNDLLANALVCILIGDEIRHYRALHWQHHLKLGATDDTEVSYHYAPDFEFALATASGVHAWRVFKNHRADKIGENSSAGQARDRNALVRGLAAHGLLLLLLVLSGFWSAAVAWVAAVAIVFPYLSALRQQLEHRSLTAARTDDFSTIAHGAINRMFAGTLGARAFGSAGFWRHLLHHWEPSVSYTRYDDLEKFFMQTELSARIDEARTSYLSVWKELARGGTQAF